MVKDKRKCLLVPCKFLSFYALKKYFKNNKNPTFHKLSVEWMDVGKGYVQGNGHKKIHISNQPSCVQLLPNAHGWLRWKI